MRIAAAGEAGVGSGALQALETLASAGGGIIGAVLYYRVARRDSRSSSTRSMVQNAQDVAQMAIDVTTTLHAEAEKREALITSQAAKIRELEAENANLRRGSNGASRDLSP